jgi:hypothetical protein
MTERYLTFTEETNALDYLEQAARFIREASSDDRAWKWVTIALHGALYGFAICACKGTDYHTVTRKPKRGDRQLISFRDALSYCQDPKRMNKTVFSKPLILTAEQKIAIQKLQRSLRNPFEHFIPTSWHVEIHGMPTVAIHCLEVIRSLTIVAASNLSLCGEQFASIERVVAESIAVLRSMPLHQEHVADETAAPKNG